MTQFLRIKLIQYVRLTKFKVDIIVALTGVFGYLFGKGAFNLLNLSQLFFGGLLITASAHIINQMIERNLDSQMSRTAKRPLATREISLTEAFFLLSLFSVSGFTLLYFLNPYSAYISFVSLIMYGFLYTPLKQISRLSIYIGAIPGALPILIGYVAATGTVDKFAILLFLFQVLWQLPHSWAIVWLWHKDYTAANYDLLPLSGGKTYRNALLIYLSSFLLLPILIMMYQYSFLNLKVFLLLLIITTGFISTAYIFFKKQSTTEAKNLLKSSVIYLPLVQIIIILTLYK